MRITRFLPAIGLALLVLLTGFPSLGQAPKSGGWLNLRLREDLPQGFAIHESPTISTMWPAMPCFSNLVLFDPMKTAQRGERHRRAGREVVLAGQLPQAGLLPAAGVKWHDGRPFTARDVDVHLRHAPGGARTRPGCGSILGATGARSRCGRRGRSADGDLPAEAAPALTPADARLRLHADLRRPPPRRQLPHGLRRHRSLQAEGMAAGRVRRVREEPRLLREGTTLSGRAALSDHRGTEHRDRGAPGGTRGRGLPRRHTGGWRISSGARSRASRHAGGHRRPRSPAHQHARPPFDNPRSAGRWTAPSIATR